MTAAEYLAFLGSDVLQTCGAMPSHPLAGVSNNSARMERGFLFCAIPGSKVDGHRFLPDAVAKGASVLVCSVLPAAPDPDRFWIRVADPYLAWACACEQIFGFPARNLHVHAVTGTNGKTSTAFLLRHFLQAAGRSAALLTTVINDVGDGAPGESAGTMPDALALQTFFRTAERHGVSDLVMEASSHGLHQHRSGKLRYASAVFTNLTGDHLDYHKTMRNYFEAKELLFTEMLADGAPAVINIDDVWGRELLSVLRQSRPSLRLVGMSESDQKAACLIRHASYSLSGTAIDVRLHGRELHLQSPLLGLHNVRNLLCAFCVAEALGIPESTLVDAVRTAPPAPGRLEPFRLPSGALAFVDYAHTDDALARVLDALRALSGPDTRIITMFGCGGDRDRTKRPRMGRAVAEKSDFAIVTSDNPRSESPEAIIAEILPGLGDAPHTVEPDRARAIAAGVTMSRPGDLLLLAGKGHETYQEINGVKHHFDDREILLALGACRV